MENYPLHLVIKYGDYFQQKKKTVEKFKGSKSILKQLLGAMVRQGYYPISIR